MRLTFLGTGTSNGVPVIGCNCAVCHNSDPRDKRLRTSALIETENTRVLIDCGPDFRQQILPLLFRKIDGILITHIHYDHVAGIDDVRPFCTFGTVNIFANSDTCQGLQHNMSYCFGSHLYPGVPHLALHAIAPHEPLHIGDLQIIPVEVMHDKMPILGFRIGTMAYITDMKTISDTELPYLQGIDTLVVNALRWKRPHHSHQLVADAITFSRKLGVRRTFLTHLTHDIGLHAEAEKRLPEGIHFAHDGLVIDI